MAIVYIETNFLMSIATGQDFEATNLLSNRSPGVRLAIPEACFMEALSVLEGKRRQRHRLAKDLDQDIKELSRDRTSPSALALKGHLDQALIENTRLILEIDKRLFDAMLSLSKTAELIGLQVATLDQSLRPDPLLDDPSDSLILFIILDHARHQVSEAKAFLSADKHFGTTEVRQALLGAGIEKYFTDAKNALGWLQSQPSR